MKPKVMMVATEVPGECMRHAQVLIVGERSWHLLAPTPWRMHCLLHFAPVPSVECAVVDVRGVQDDESMGRVIGACVDPQAGVLNMDGLLTGLEALGAKVQKPVKVVYSH